MSPVATSEQPNARAFALLVSVLGGRSVRFAFDQDSVVVGRGVDADLRIEHAGVARTQFVLQRGVGSAGEARFRITPYETTNPTHVNERPAVEGTLVPGDVIAVGEVRVVLERAVRKAAAKEAKGGDIPPLRAVLLGVTTLMALYVGYLFFGNSGSEDGGELASAATKLFTEAQPGSIRCGNPLECETRAHDAYARGKKLLSQAGIDPGNLYRAAKELERASRFRELSGRAMNDLSDVDALQQQARARSEAEFQDARFRLSRAIAANDLPRCSTESALLAHIVPDEHHPYRVKLDAYRRTLPKQAAPELK